MNKKQILVVSHDVEMGNMLAVLASKNEEFDLTLADSDERAIELSHQQNFDLAVVDGTDSQVNLKKLFAILPILQRDLLLLPYEGEASVELEEKISDAFYKRKAERLQRLMVLDASQPDTWHGMPVFSAN